MKISIIILVSTLILIINIRQESPNFQSYECLLSSQCSKTTNGSIITNNYCQLKFESDSVIISYRTEESISLDNNNTVVDEIFVKHSWQLENNIIKIHNFNDYDPIMFYKDSLIFTGKNQDITLQILEEKPPTQPRLH